MSLSCLYCVCLAGKETGLQLKWHCQGQAKAEWPIDSWPVRWPFHLTGRKCLPSRVLSASDTHRLKYLKKKSEHSLSRSLPFARFQELCSGECQWLEVHSFFSHFKGHSPGFLLHFRSVTWPSSSSGQRIMSAGWAVSLLQIEPVVICGSYLQIKFFL